MSRRDKECGDKTQYAKRQDAIDALRYLRRTTLTTADMTVYRCEYCGFYHFGHRRRRRR